MKSRAIVYKQHPDGTQIIVETGPWIEHQNPMDFVSCPLNTPRQMADDEIMTTETNFEDEA